MQGCHWRLPSQSRVPDVTSACHTISQSSAQPRRASVQAACSNGISSDTSYKWLRDPARTSQQVLQHFLKEHEATRAWQRSVSKLRQQLQGSLENHLWRAALALAAGQEDEAASLGPVAGTSLLYWQHSPDIDAGTSLQPGVGGAASWQYTQRPSAVDPSRTMHVLVASHQQQQLQPPREIVLLDEGKEAARVAAQRAPTGTQEFLVNTFCVSHDMSLFAFTSTDKYIPAAGIRGLSFTLHVRYSSSGAPAVAPITSATGPLAWLPFSGPNTHTNGSKHHSRTQQLLYILAEGSQLQLLQLPSGTQRRSRGTMQTGGAVRPATLLKYDHVLRLRYVQCESAVLASKRQGMQLQQGSMHPQMQRAGAAVKSSKGRQEEGLRSRHQQLQPDQGKQGTGQPSPRRTQPVVLVEAVDSDFIARASWVVRGGSCESEGINNSIVSTELHASAGHTSTPGVTLVQLTRPSIGQRVAAAPCEAPCGGFLVWSWDAEGCQQGKLSWCDPFASHLQPIGDDSFVPGRAQPATTQMRSSPGPSPAGAGASAASPAEGWVAAEHVLLKPPRGWAMEKVQVAGAHVLVMYRQVAVPGQQAVPEVQPLTAEGGTGDDGHVLRAAANATLAWLALQQQEAGLQAPSPAGVHGLHGGEGGGIMVGGTTRLRIEVYSLRAGATATHGIRGGAPGKGASAAFKAAPTCPHLQLEGAEDVVLEGHPLAKAESLQWRRVFKSQGPESAGIWRHTVRLVTSAPCTPAVVLNRELSRPVVGRGTRISERVSLAVPGVKYGTLHIRSKDGTLIPVSLAMPDPVLQAPGSRAQAPPVVLRVYGAYGVQDDMRVAPKWQALIERGVTVATVHVRGGGMHGAPWHEAGRGHLKLKGLQDLLAAAEALIAGGHCHPRKLCLVADSAGGWLAGAALNQRPNLFCASVLTVAALDVLNTFNEDPSPGDSAELGDARGDPQVHRMVRALSPADNLPDPQAILKLWTSQHRLWPHTLVRVGLFDSRVPPWDPGRYVAKLKDAIQAGEKAVLDHCHQGLPASKQGPAVVPRPRILMQVKPCGHEGYDAPADDATFAAFLIDAICEGPE